MGPLKYELKKHSWFRYSRADPAPPLPPEAASMVEKAWRAGDPGEVLISTPTSLYSYEFKVGSAGE